MLTRPLNPLTYPHPDLGDTEGRLEVNCRWLAVVSARDPAGTPWSLLEMYAGGTALGLVVVRGRAARRGRFGGRSFVRRAVCVRGRREPEPKLKAFVA